MTPTEADINIWWPNPEEKVTLRKSTNIIKINTLDKEEAYLAMVFISPRGRNFSYQTVFIQPSTELVIELEYPFGSKFEVMDFDNDGVSEIILDAFGSGQGTFQGTESIVQMNGSKPIVLHQIEYEDNEGYWGIEHINYYSKYSKWKFTDLNNDGVLDLAEENFIKTVNTSFSEQLFYVFKDNRYFKYKRVEDIQSGFDNN